VFTSPRQMRMSKSRRRLHDYAGPRLLGARRLLAGPVQAIGPRLVPDRGLGADQGSLCENSRSSIMAVRWT
jgi:hypothetical protein